MLIEAVYSFDRTVQNVLLSTIEALESKEVLVVCDQMLHAIEEMTVPKNVLGKHFIFLTANILLQRIDLSDIVAKYYSRCLSEYRYWLFLDAVATRMMVLHHLGAEVITSWHFSIVIIVQNSVFSLGFHYCAENFLCLFIIIARCISKSCAFPCCVVFCPAVLWCAVVCCGVLWCAVVCCGVVWCGVVCCAVLCCVLLRCAKLCFVVLC